MIYCQKYLLEIKLLKVILILIYYYVRVQFQALTQFQNFDHNNYSSKYLMQIIFLKYCSPTARLYIKFV